MSCATPGCGRPVKAGGTLCSGCYGRLERMTPAERARVEGAAYEHALRQLFAAWDEVLDWPTGPEHDAGFVRHMHDVIEPLMAKWFRHYRRVRGKAFHSGREDGGQMLELDKPEAPHAQIPRRKRSSAA